MPAKTQREREADERQAKLERMKEQVDDGSLVIRKMTDEERARFSSGRDEDEPTQGRRRRRSSSTSPRPLPPRPR